VRNSPSRSEAQPEMKIVCAWNRGRFSRTSFECTNGGYGWTGQVYAPKAVRQQKLNRACGSCIPGIVMPRECPLDYPSPSPQPAAMFSVALREPRHDAAGTQTLADCLRVITTVASTPVAYAPVGASSFLSAFSWDSDSWRTGSFRRALRLDQGWGMVGLGHGRAHEMSTSCCQRRPLALFRSHPQFNSLNLYRQTDGKGADSWDRTVTPGRWVSVLDLFCLWPTASGFVDIHLASHQ
jgi:hypothetical protein